MMMMMMIVFLFYYNSLILFYVNMYTVVDRVLQLCNYIHCNCYFLVRAPCTSTLLKGNPRNEI